jgi:hypothetical protein
MYGWFLHFQCSTTKGWRKLFGHLAVSHRIPFPDDAPMLIVSMIIDLGFWEALKKLIVRPVNVCTYGIVGHLNTQQSSTKYCEKVSDEVPFKRSICIRTNCFAVNLGAPRLIAGI